MIGVAISTAENILFNFENSILKALVAFQFHLVYLTIKIFHSHQRKIMRRTGIGIVFVLVIICFVSCDQGLAPVSLSVPPSGIRGFVYFNHWPPADSVVDLRLAALRNPPSSNLINEVLQGKAQFTGSLTPYGADSIAYTLILNPGKYVYVGVAQQFGPNIEQDWRVVGVYHAVGESVNPDSVTVPVDSIVSGINVYVDFNNIPPQPL